MKSRPFYWPMAGLLAGLVVFGALFWPVVRDPGAFLFNPTLDGLKNYFTLAWYVRHDTGTHLSGMNYPWGEHVVFTDNQPLLAWLARRSLGPTIPLARLFGLLHLWLLLAQVLSIPPLVALLRRCRLPGAYSIAAATLISLMAPQLTRMLGHHALAVSAAIPWWWYLLTRATENPRRALYWWLLYAGISLALGLIHPYYLPLGTLLPAAHSLVWLWQRERLGQSFWLGVGLAMLLPIAAFQLGMAATDPFAADRPTEPFGFFRYSASVWSVFLPTEAPLLGWWKHHLFEPAEHEWEGFAYVGFVTTFVLLMTLGRLFRRIRQRAWRKLRWPAVPKPLRAGGWAALLILLFSMGWPLRWGLEGLLEIAGPLRQFRSIGRFAWLSYYLFTVYAAWGLYVGWRALRQRGHTRLAAVVLTTAFLIWTAEALLTATNKRSYILHPPEGAGRTLRADITAQDDFRRRLRQAGHQPADFQAILPLPHFVIGSEKLYLEPTGRDESVYQAMRAALETDRPLAAAMLSRSALWQAEALAQLVAPHPIEKLLLPRLRVDGRPLLVVTSPKVPLSATEQALLARCRVFYRDQHVWLAELPLTALAGKADSLATRFAADSATLVQHQKPSVFWTSDAGSGVVVDGLDEGDDPRAAAYLAQAPALLGQGSYGVRQGDRLLFDGPVTAGLYEASVWAYLRGRGTPLLRVQVLDASGRRLTSDSTEAKVCSGIIGDWVRVSVQLRVNRPGQRLKVWCEGRRYVIDEFELRPVTTTVWRRDPLAGTLVWNNYPLLSPAPHPAHWLH